MTKGFKKFLSTLVVSMMTVTMLGVSVPKGVFADNPGYGLGINDHILYRTNGEIDVTMAKYQESQTKYTRINVDWNTLEPSDDVYSPTRVATVDYYFQQASAYGIKVLVCIAYAPAWANGGNSGSGYPPLATYYSKYADFCEWFLRRYATYADTSGKRTLEGIEIWNEPDLCDFFWKGGESRYSATAGTQYGNLVVEAGGRLKSVRSSIGATDVLIGAPVISDTHNVSYYPWMDSFYAVPNVTSYYDVFTWHTYWENAGSTGYNPPELPPCFSTTNQRLSVLGKLTADVTGEIWPKIVASGDSLKPNWCTEIGGSAQSSTADHTNRYLSFAEQQTHAADAINVLTTGSITNMKRLYWYELFDEPGHSTVVQQKYGLIALNNTNPIVYSGNILLTAATFTPKAAYDIYKNTTKEGGSGGGSTGNAHAGTWSAKAVFSGTPSYINLYQKPTGIPTGTSYTASFWMKGTGKITLRIMSGDWATTIATQEFTATSTWTQYTLPAFSTGSNTTLVYCLMDSSNVAGTIYIDDCFMGASGTGVLTNGGYESSSSGWTLGSKYTVGQY